MDQAVIDQTLKFFTDAQLLQKELKQHVERSGEEAKAIAAADDKVRDKKLYPTRYGVYVTLPSSEDAAKGAPPTAQLVELGDPVCQDGKPGAGGCAGTPRGFLVRADEMQSFSEMGLAAPAGEAVPGRKLLPLGLTGVLAALFRGGAATVSEYYYDLRIRDIEARVTGLLETGKALEKQLTSTKNKGKKFTFFL
jgi:hypothetical protein